MAGLSSHRLERLPAPNELERLLQSLAVLDAILSPAWEYRYYSFNARWDEAKNQRMGSMRNGSGDELFVLFQGAGAFLKGFAHESPMAGFPNATERLTAGTPDVFQDSLEEPAFNMQDATFVLWNIGEGWQSAGVALPGGKDPDGSEGLLEMFSGDPRDYVRFAEDYYEAKVPVGIVERVYAHESLSAAMVRAINPELTLADLEDDLDEIGYPKGAS